MFFRHALAILVLPVTVVAVVPIWIANRYSIALRLPVGGADVALFLAGVASFLIGFALFATTLRLFAVEGRGTLAPWDPPRRLVVQGPYQHVRNPMISGVIFMLVGEALLLRSIPHAVWALTFLAINAVYIPLLEEPFLRQRFGAEYREYCEHVRRFIPRRTPWRAA